MAKCEKHSLVFDVRENGKVEFVRCQNRGCGKEWQTITTKKNGRWVKVTTVTKEPVEEKKEDRKGMESP